MKFQLLKPGPRCFVWTGSGIPLNLISYSSFPHSRCTGLLSVTELNRPFPDSRLLLCLNLIFCISLHGWFLLKVTTSMSALQSLPQSGLCQWFSLSSLYMLLSQNLSQSTDILISNYNYNYYYYWCLTVSPWSQMQALWSQEPSLSDLSALYPWGKRSRCSTNVCKTNVCQIKE